MLENKKRTPEELKKYMIDLREWLAQERDKPIEEMADFFSNRIDNYDIRIFNPEFFQHIFG